MFMLRRICGGGVRPSEGAFCPNWHRLVTCPAEVGDPEMRTCDRQRPDAHLRVYDENINKQERVSYRQKL